MVFVNISYFQCDAFFRVRRVSVCVSEQVCYFLCLVLPGKAECSEVPVFLHTLCDAIPRNTIPRF